MDPINYISAHLHYRSLPDDGDYTQNHSAWTNNDSNCINESRWWTNHSYRHDIPPGSAYVSMISSFASMVGSTLIILSFVLWRDLRTVARAILVFLAIADFMTGIGYLFGSAVYIHYEVVDHDDKHLPVSYYRLCKAQSFFTTVFPISSFLWTAHLAIYLFVAFVLRKVQLARKLILPFHIIAWGIPLLICIPAVAKGILGAADSRSSVSWCWVSLNQNVSNKEDARNVLIKFYGFEFLCGKIWEILACIISLVLCITVKVVLATRVSGSVICLMELIIV